MKANPPNTIEPRPAGDIDSTLPSVVLGIASLHSLKPLQQDSSYSNDARVLALTEQLKATHKELSAMRQKLHNVLDAVSLPIARWSEGCVLEDCNAHFEQYASQPRSQMVGKTVAQLFGDEVYEQINPYFARAFKGEKCNYSRYVTQLSRPQWMRVNLVPDGTQQGALVNAIYTIAVDIDEEKRAIDSLRESQKRLDIFTENIPNLMSYFDSQYVYRFVSKSFLRHFKLSAQEILGRTIWEVFGRTSWQELKPYADRALSGVAVDFERVEKSDEGKAIWQRVQYMPDLAEDGSVKGVYSTRMDITDIKQAAAALKRDADWDNLTQIFNRNYFNNALAMALMQAQSAPFSLLYLDLDGFKQINDTLGHSVGDELLSHVAQSLKSTVTANDTLARIGGDEFAVLSYGKAASNSNLADALLQAANKPYRIGDIKLSLTMSIGIVHVNHPNEHTDMRSLIQKADAAMYEAKRSGKNRWVLAS
jgi:diguanylate cyclase (GGDEF)-like protein/PAS domain S-box-containing protein